MYKSPIQNDNLTMAGLEEPDLTKKPTVGPFVKSLSLLNSALFRDSYTAHC
ncbi:hypothetical protein Hdeb2414_s0011g00372091 [Helianthus debilis subsp. tardiflorus]